MAEDKDTWLPFEEIRREPMASNYEAHAAEINRVVKEDREQAYVDAAEAYRDARVRYASAFTLARHQLGDKATDGQAHQAAILATNDELTLYQVKLSIARQHAVELVWSLEDPQ